MKVRYDIQGLRYANVWQTLKMCDTLTEATKEYLSYIKETNQIYINRYQAIRLAKLTTAFIDNTFKVKEILEYKELER